MGTLKPDTTYIYERVDNVTYAREFGADPSTRRAIGWDYGYAPQGVASNSINWVDLLEKANTNISLQKAVQRAILIYQTIKDNE